MPRCIGEKPDGSPCERIVKASQGYCSSHDPAREEERRQAASKAGGTRPSKEVAGLKAEVRSIIDDLRHAKLEAKDASVILQGYRVLRELIELDRRVAETTEIQALRMEMEELKRVRSRTHTA